MGNLEGMFLRQNSQNAKTHENVTYFQLNHSLLADSATVH